MTITICKCQQEGGEWKRDWEGSKTLSTKIWQGL